MNEEQFQQAIAGATEQRDVSAREVSNGFVLAGVRRFLEPSTGAIRLQQNVESVAASAEAAGAAITAFLSTGKF